MPKFSLELEDLGAFPNLKFPRVAWVGVGGDIKAVTRLQKKIDNNMEKLGFKPEKRGFSSHLTLGRVRDKANRKEKIELSRVISSLEVKNLSFAVSTVNLMKSTLTREGAVYNELATIVLDRK